MLYDDIYSFSNNYAYGRWNIMHELSVWANSVCMVAIICALFEMFVPEGTLAKLVNFVLGLFLIIAILVPFANLIQSNALKNSKINIEQQNTNFSDDINDLTIAYGKSAIEKIIIQCLEEKEIEYKKIDINMDSSNNESIDIVRVDIYLPIKYRNQLSEIQNEVKEKTGISPNIYVE